MCGLLVLAVPLPPLLILKAFERILDPVGASIGQDLGRHCNARDLRNRPLDLIAIAVANPDAGQ